MLQTKSIHWSFLIIIKIYYIITKCKLFNYFNFIKSTLLLNLGCLGHASNSCSVFTGVWRNAFHSKEIWPGMSNTLCTVKFTWIKSKKALTYKEATFFLPPCVTYIIVPIMCVYRVAKFGVIFTTFYFYFSTKQSFTPYVSFDKSTVLPLMFFYHFHNFLFLF